MKIDWFIIALISAIVGSVLFPEVGVMKSFEIGSTIIPFDLAQIAEWGIMLIFFFYGVKLSPRQVLNGLKNWRVHLLVQLATFVLFPLIIIAIKPLISNEIIWLSLFFLAALPSTVSSSVVMVSIAEGNMPSAIFNATISGFIGIVVTPLWMGLFMARGDWDFDTSSIILKLVVQILVPVIAGGFLNRWLGNFVAQHKKAFKQFDQSVVVLIVFTSFSKSVVDKVFTDISLLSIVAMGAGMIALFFVVFFVLLFISRKIGFDYKDTITVLFCGSKKSLMHGAVISKVMFQGMSVGGFALVPIMIYHALQLIVVSYLAPNMRKLFKFND